MVLRSHTSLTLELPEQRLCPAPPKYPLLEGCGFHWSAVRGCLAKGLPSLPHGHTASTVNVLMEACGCFLFHVASVSVTDATKNPEWMMNTYNILKTN